jgi:hypothetical protein
MSPKTRDAETGRAGHPRKALSGLVQLEPGLYTVRRSNSVFLPHEDEHDEEDEQEPRASTKRPPTAK